MMGVAITKTVNYIPNKCITNYDLEKMVDTNDEWIFSRSGISKRYWAENETLEQMTYKCVEKFTKQDLKDVEVILLTSMSNTSLSPALSAKVAGYLNLENTMCIDLNAACSGYIYALNTANAYIESKMYKKVMIISAEKMTNILDKEDRNTVILFGDGVGASIVEKTKDSGILHFENNTLATTNELYVNDKNHLKMHGQDVFKFAYKSIIDCIDKTLTKANVYINDIDYFIFHQANIRIINKVAKKYNIPNKKIITNIEQYANTSSASIPILLSQNEIEKNKKVFLCGFGAGLSYGSILYKN